MAHEVFISYSRKDTDLVNVIEQELKARDISCFMDRRGINLGDDFAEIISKAIFECKIMLFVWSENSNQSENTANEIALAIEFGKTIVPFKIGEFQPHYKLAYRLVRFNRIDIVAFNRDKVIELADKLAQQLGLTVSGAQKERMEEEQGQKTQKPTQSPAPPQPIQINTQTSGDNKIEGVEINGVVWAPCNVDAPGTFAAKPGNGGMYYQWNRKKGWPISSNVTGWDSNTPTGDTWEKANDPSPAGWRVPTLDEIKALLDTDKVAIKWIGEYGVNGTKFTDKTSGKSIFLPAAGFGDFTDGRWRNLSASGSYWSNKQRGSDNNHAYGIIIGDDGMGLYGAHLYDQNIKSSGFSVRPVAE